MNFKTISAIFILINVVLLTPAFASEMTPQNMDQNNQNMSTNVQFNQDLKTAAGTTTKPTNETKKNMTNKTNSTVFNNTNCTNSTIFNDTNCTNSTIFNDTNCTNSTTFNDTNNTNVTTSKDNTLKDGIIIGVSAAVGIGTVATLVIGLAVGAPTAIALGICGTVLFTPYVVVGVVAGILDLCDVVDIWDWWW